MMKLGNFYFLKNQYFIDFPDKYLMKNKETIKGVLHNRPCFYAFYDDTTTLYWLIPISSNLSKFKKIYKKKIDRYGVCDNIVFGNVLGHEKAFLIQNICPVIPRYIENEYLDKEANIPVKVEGVFEQELIKKAKKVLVLYRKGMNLIFPDVLKIERELLKEITND